MWWGGVAGARRGVMDIDYRFFITQRAHNAAWNLLCANNAPVILTFVHEAFIKQSRTSAPESELIEILKDIIFAINGGYLNYQSSERLDNHSVYADYMAESGADIDSIPEREREALYKAASKVVERKRKEQERLDSWDLKEDPAYYLRAWSSEKERYFFCEYDGRSGSEPYYKITPELQKAYSFVVSMHQSSTNFVPTESRFKEILEILKEVHMSTQGNAQLYLEELLEQRAVLDAKIESAKRGEILSLSDGQIRERFLQFQHDAIELLDDFRQVDANLCSLDKEIMQDILNWTGPRGELLDKYFDQNEYIENTDQGRSVKAFSRLLLSSSDDELIMTRIDNLINHPAVANLQKDERIHNIHDSWLNARLNIERIMGASTKRIKSFLQPANLDANRFLKERIKSITSKVSALSKDESLNAMPPSLFTLEIPKADIHLPFDRPLATVSDRLEFNTKIKDDDFKADDHKLFDQVVVNPELLFSRINEFMQDRDEVSLYEIVQKYPLDHGISELTTYVKLAMFAFDVIEDSSCHDLYRWEAIDPEGNRVARVAKLKHLTLKRR